MIQDILSENIIPRTLYLEKINSYLKSPLIKVIVWQRRVGKSTILKSVIQKLVREWDIVPENVFYLNKEYFAFDSIQTVDDLRWIFWDFLRQKKPGRFFVWIDEIQEIQGWEKFINGLLAEYQEDAEIFITGSNSFLFSSELATYITGRYIEFPVYPLSFSEFCLFKQAPETRDNFLEYLKYGWLPAIFKMQYSDDIIFSYLQSVYNTIVLKDIIQYHNIRNVAFFQDLYKYTLSNIGSIVSGKSIKDYLKSQNIAIGNETIMNFLHYAESTFLLHKVYSVNPDTKKYFEIYNKYYVWDLGLRNSLVWYDLKRDIGKLLENYVFLELRRKGYKIKIGRLSSGKEIDFIAEKQWIVKYFQVSYLLGSEETMHREYASLEEIDDNWEKYVVSFDDMDFWIHEWIRHISIMDIAREID